MTREQTEKKIRDKFVEILKIYKEYNPEDEFLELVYIDNTIFFYNRHWETENKIDYFESSEKE